MFLGIMQCDELRHLRGEAILLSPQLGMRTQRMHLSRQKATHCVSLLLFQHFYDVFLHHSTSCDGHKIEYLPCCTVSKQIEEAENVVTGLMEDINEQLFVPTAIAEITGAQPISCSAPIVVRHLLQLSMSCG